MSLIVRQPFHQPADPFVDEDGRLIQHGYRLLNSLWLKTGGGQLATANAVILTQQSLGAGTPITMLDALTQAVIGQALIAANQGTTHTILHGDVNGHLFFALLDLSDEVTGNLDVTHLDSGANADIFHMWAGDGHWRVPSQDMPVRVITAAGAVNVTNTDWAVIVKKLVGAATVVNLPAGAQGNYYRVKDGKGDASTHNITVTAAGGDTIDGAATLVLSNDFQAVDLVFGTEWSVF